MITATALSCLVDHVLLILVLLTSGVSPTLWCDIFGCKPYNMIVGSAEICVIKLANIDLCVFFPTLYNWACIIVSYASMCFINVQSNVNKLTSRDFVA